MGYIRPTLFCLLLVAGFLEANQFVGQPKMVLTNKVNGLEPVAEFSCSEKIHGYLTLPEKAIGSHTLEGVWIAPSGAEQEHSTNHLDFAPPGRQTAYVWLEFPDLSGGSLGDFRERDSGSQEKNQFAGLWQVKVYWDGQPLVESKFRVKCSG